MKKLALRTVFVAMLALTASSAWADQISLIDGLTGSASFTTSSFSFTGTCGVHAKCLSGDASIQPGNTPGTYSMWITGAAPSLTGSAPDYGVSATLGLEVIVGGSDLKATINLTDLLTVKTVAVLLGDGTVTSSDGVFAPAFPPMHGSGVFDFTLILNHALGGGPDGASVSAGEFKSPVPEPTSLALMGSGILGLAGLIRRKSR